MSHETRTCTPPSRSSIRFAGEIPGTSRRCLPKPPRPRDAAVASLGQPRAALVASKLHTRAGRLDERPAGLSRLSRHHRPLQTAKWREREKKRAAGPTEAGLTCLKIKYSQRAWNHVCAHVYRRRFRRRITFSRVAGCSSSRLKCETGMLASSGACTPVEQSKREGEGVAKVKRKERERAGSLARWSGSFGSSHREGARGALHSIQLAAKRGRVMLKGSLGQGGCQRSCARVTCTRRWIGTLRETRANWPTPKSTSTAERVNASQRDWESE